MTLAFDIASSGNGTGTTVTVSHTCSSSGNRVLIVDGILGAGNDAGFTMSATYNGVAMTSLASRHSNDATAGFVEKFYLINPDSGTHDIVVTRSAGTVSSLIAAGKSYTDASQTAANYTGTVVSAAGNTATPTVDRTGTASTSIVDDAACTGVTITGLGANQTQRWIQNVNEATAAGNAQGSTEPGNGGTVTMSHTSAGDFWAIIAVEVKEQLSVAGAMAVQAAQAFPAF